MSFLSSFYPSSLHPFPFLWFTHTDYKAKNRQMKHSLSNLVLVLSRLTAPSSWIILLTKSFVAVRISEREILRMYLVPCFSSSSKLFSPLLVCWWLEEVESGWKKGWRKADENEIDRIHGEISAINACTEVFQKKNMSATQIFAAWGELSIYTNAESCPMCASAIRWAGFKEYSTFLIRGPV